MPRTIRPTLILGFLVLIPRFSGLTTNSSNANTPTTTSDIAVGPQYDTTHVYVAPDDFDRFVSSLIATFGGTTTKQGVFTVTPMPSKTMSQLVLTPVGTFSVFGFKTPIPYPFGNERTGYLVTNLDSAADVARSVGADVQVAPFNDPIGRDAIIQFPGGVNTQIYWHTTPPSYKALTTIPENRVYVSADRVKAFIQSFLAFSHGEIASDEPHAAGVEIGRPDDSYHRVTVRSSFGKVVVFVTDGHLPFPFGRETTGYEVSDLDATLTKGKAAGVEILVPPHASDGRRSAMVRFPGGYIAEIHAQTAKSVSTFWGRNMLRSVALMTVVAITASRYSLGQSADAGSSYELARTYSLLRSDEDWSFLADRKLRNDYLDWLKYIPIRGGTDSRYVTVGGEAREVWEQIGNDNWGEQALTNGYFNQRYMLSADVHFGKNVRTFVELKSGLNDFRAGGPRPIDEKRLDFQDCFLELGPSEREHNSIRLRVGRQELEYGSGRLIDVREGPNVRLSFTGFVVKSKFDRWQIDALAVRPDTDQPGFFDNRPNHLVSFWGIYATKPIRKSTLDLYYLGLSRKNATFERGMADENRHSFGARLSRPVATERPGADFDYEALWQTGTFGANRIDAWTVASETGYRFTNTKLKPRLSFKADISSGDHPHSSTLSTFNPLFPKGNYFGVLATAGPGPINFIDFHPNADFSLSKIKVSFNWIVQWRQSLDDGVYAVPGFLIRAADGSRARFVGHRPGVEIRYQVTPHVWCQADYGIFYAGAFLKQTAPGRNLSYFALWTGYKF